MDIHCEKGIRDERTQQGGSLTELPQKVQNDKRPCDGAGDADGAGQGTEQQESAEL
jgi:hypothetical protein